MGAPRLGSDGVEESGPGLADAEKKRRPGWRRMKRSRPWGNAFVRYSAVAPVGLWKRQKALELHIATPVTLPPISASSSDPPSRLRRSETSGAVVVTGTRGRELRGRARETTRGRWRAAPARQRACLVSKKNSTVHVRLNIQTHVWSIKCS